MKRRLTAFFGCFVLLFPVFSYSYSKQIFNPGQKDSFRFKQNLVIPIPSDEKSNVLASIKSICVDINDIIYILDAKDLQVKVFGTDGTFLRAFGTKGQGPGEFQSPVEMFLKDNTISVYDFGTKRLSKFTPDGRHLEDVGLRELGDSFRLEAEDDSAIYAITIEKEPDGTRLRKLVRFDKSTKLATIISRVKDGIIHPNFNPLVDTFILRIRKDKRLVWVLQQKYEISITNKAGELVKRITKKYNQVKISTEDKESLINKKLGGKANIPQGINLIWPKYYSPISSLIIDDSDWIYIRTNEKNGGGKFKYDVFDSDGEFRSSFFFEHLIILIKNKMAYTVAENADGFPLVKRYEMLSNKR